MFLTFASDYFAGLRALHERGIIHGDVSLGNLFLGMTEDIAGFVGDLDLAKVDLGTVKKLFPESRKKPKGSPPNTEQSVSLLVKDSDIRMA